MTIYEFPAGELESLDGLAVWASQPGNAWHPGQDPPGTLDDRRRLLKATEITKQGVRPVVISIVFTLTH
jgi:hypothetical protein